MWTSGGAEIYGGRRDGYRSMDNTFTAAQAQAETEMAIMKEAIQSEFCNLRKIDPIVYDDDDLRALPAPSQTCVLNVGHTARPRVSDHNLATRVLRASEGLPDAPGVAPPLRAVPEEELRELAFQPLGKLAAEFVVREPRAMTQATVESKMHLDVSSHPTAQSVVARAMLARLASDVEAFAQATNSAFEVRCIFIDAEAIISDPEGRGAKAAAIHQLERMVRLLEQQRADDGMFVRHALTLCQHHAQDASENAEGKCHELFQLRQISGAETRPPLDVLFCLLISSQAAEDLRSLNPFLGSGRVEELFNVAIAAILAALRIGLINRVLTEAHGLLALVQNVVPPGSESARASAIVLKARTLADLFLTRRHYMHEDLSFDPRFLLFEFQHNILLRQSQVALISEFHEATKRGVPLVKQMLYVSGSRSPDLWVMAFPYLRAAANPEVWGSRLVPTGWGAERQL